MGKFTKLLFKSETLNLCECSDGLYLWDETQKMNVAMYAKTERDAFIQALMYYQRRLKQVEKEHKELSKKVESFLSQFADKED